MKLNKSMDIVNLYGMLNLKDMIETRKVSSDDLELLLLIVKLKQELVARSKQNA